MTKNFTLKKTTFFQLKKLMSLAMYFYLQTLFITPVKAQDPVVTNSATYDVFMNLDPSRGLNPTNFATDVSSYLEDMGAASGSYKISTSAVTLDPTDVAKWDVYDHYDYVWYANQAAWTASPGGFNNGNIPSNWYYYGVSDAYAALNSKITIAQLLGGTGTWGQTGRLQSHIYPYVENGKPAMQFYGYSAIGAADFLYYPADVASTKTVKFDIDATNVITHTLQKAGFLINCGTTGTGISKTISGYIMLFTWSPAGSTTPPTGLASVEIYKLTNVNVDNLHNSGLGAPGTLIATSSFTTFYTKSHIELSITSTSLTATIQQLDGSGNLYGSKSTMFNSQALTNTLFGGFGPFVMYASHGCTIASAFRYSNLEMAFGGVLSGNSSLESYQYADYLANSTNRFFVNLTNTSATNYAATTNDMDNAYLTKIKDDKVVMITDESAGTYLPGTLNENIKNVTNAEPTDATIAAALHLADLSSLSADQKLAAKVAYLIKNTTLGAYGSIEASATTSVASLYLMDGPGTDASWTGAKQVNEIMSWLVSGDNIDIYVNPENSVNSNGLTATYKMTDPVGTKTTLTTSVGGNGKLYFAFPKTSAPGEYSITLSYATGGTITSTVPSTAIFNYAPVPELDGTPGISGTVQYGQTLTVTPNVTSVPGITGTLSYKWKANGTIIAGATGSTYTLTANELGKTISCDITSNAQTGTLSATIAGTVSKVSLTPVTVTAVNSKTYNGNTATTGGTISFSGMVNSETPTYSASIVWTTANFGTTTVNVTGISLTTLADRYVLSATSLSNITPGNNATITKAPLTVTGSSITSKVYDGNASATISGAILSGKAGSDDVSLGNATSGTFNNANSGTGKSVTTAMTISGAASGNYSLIQPTLTGSITVKTVTITGVTAASKVYDGSNNATLSGGSVATGVGTETLTINAGTGTFADKNVGTKAVTALGYSLTDGTNGGLASNYNLSAQPVIANQSITAKPVIITGVTAASKVYDGFAAATLSGGSVTTGVGTETLAINAGTGTFADKNVGTKAVTALGYSITNGTNGGLASNYSLSAQPVIENQSITAKSVTITGVTAASKVYDGSISATLSGGSVTTGVGSETLTIDAGTGTFADKNVGTKAVTALGYSLADGTNGGLASNYSLSAQPVIANKSITAKPVTITGVTAASKVYDGSNNATLSDGSVTTYVGAETLTINAGTGTFADKNVGTKAVTALGYSLTDGTNGGLASNYNLSAQPVIANQSITAKPVIITGVTASSKGYDGSNTATLSVGSVTTGVGTETLAIIAGIGTFADKNVGTKAVTASGYSIANGTNGGLASNYSLSAQPVITNQSITAKPIDVTAVTRTKIYGEADPDLTFTFSPALIGDDSFSGALSRVTGENVGTFAINQNTLALSSNYTLNYTSADLSITAKPIAVTAETETKIYGEADPSLTFTFTPELVAGDAFSGALQRTAGENVGNYTINLNNLALSSNYNMTYTPADLTVSKATLTVTADNQTKIYGDANPALTFSYSGWKNVNTTADLTSLPSASTTVDLSSPVNVYSDAITLSGGVDENYDFTYVPSDFSVTKATLTVTADNQTKIYGDANPALTFSYSGWKNDNTTADLTSLPSASTTVDLSSPVNVYSDAITLSGGVDENYDFTYVPSDFSVTKATLTVAADNQTKIYGDANPELTFSYSGWKNDNTTADLATLPSASTTVDLSSPVNVYSHAITLTGGVDENYDFAYVQSDFSVTKATLSITADNKARKYGEQNPALTVSIVGFRNSDDRSVIDVMPAISTTAIPTSHAGTLPITLNGGSDNNYNLTLINGELLINRTLLLITADNKTKIYSEGNPALTISYSGFMNSEGVTDLTSPPLAETGVDANSPAGTYTLSVSGASSDNYEISYDNGSLTVTKAPLTVDVENKTSIYLNQIPSFTARYSGFRNGDNTDVLDQKPVLLSDAVNGSGAGVYDITASNGSDNNYSFIYHKGALTIGKADQVITFEAIPTGLRTTQNHELVATSTSGLPVKFESSENSIAEINGNNMSVLKEGTVVITAVQEGNNNWNPAANITQSVETLPTFENIRSLFTPNNDGMNDYWYIPDIEQYGTISVQIYNRFGKLIYKSSAYKNDWDGTYNGTPLPDAAYYYIIKSPVKGLIKGVVNIVR